MFTLAVVFMQLHNERAILFWQDQAKVIGEQAVGHVAVDVDLALTRLLSSILVTDTVALTYSHPAHLAPEEVRGQIIRTTACKVVYAPQVAVRDASA